MRRDETLKRFGLLAAILLCPAWAVATQDVYSVAGGSTTLTLNPDLMENLGWVLVNSVETAKPARYPSLSKAFSIDPDSPWLVTVEDGMVIGLSGGPLRHVGGFTFSTKVGEYTLYDFSIAPKNDTLSVFDAIDGMSVDSPRLELRGTKVGFDAASGTLTIHISNLGISKEWAETLGEPDLAHMSFGNAIVQAKAEWIGGDLSSADKPAQEGEGHPPIADGGPRGNIGPDVTFCQLFGLQQFGRSGSTVGLAVGTTSWNIGDVNLLWFEEPDPRHPFIVANLFRLKSDRFEQIGQSWIKHGFFALSNTQCGGSCSGTNGTMLGVGCTDTYSPSLNASQGGLGPRFEVNPWTGAWAYAGSHFQMHDQGTAPPHNATSHLLQVADADLDPAANAGASYFIEGVYICLDDVNVMNSVSWKPVTPNGSPGSTYSFSMSGASTRPTIGFAIDAWTGATQTVLAQVVPPVEFQSPDGRCLLSAKATDLGNGTWHYEYALYNVDMSRKAGSFSIPIGGANPQQITNIGFHLVNSHDEPFNNVPWEATIANGSITWATANNTPLRWGTLYNFRFDMQAAPITTTVTLGMFDPGTPSTVTGSTVGPTLGPPDCNLNGIDDAIDIANGTSLDCNGDEIPDECQLSGNDCNADSIPDDCQLAGNDCDGNSVPDDCQPDCNNNGQADVCDISSGSSDDCDANDIPDDCQADCDNDGIPDTCELGVVLFEDNFETDTGWTVTSQAGTNGVWERADPQQTLLSGNVAQPENDNPSGTGTLCYVTDSIGPITSQHDVDFGPTRLMSPRLDLTAGAATLRYYYWFFSAQGVTDSLTVEASNNDGASWTTLVVHNQSASAWRYNELQVDNFISRTDQMRFRFSVSDPTNDSITEGLIDDVVVTTPDCPSGCVPAGLQSAHSVATHATGPGTTAEYYVDLDLSNNPASRTSEPRASGLRTLEFQFDRDVDSASVTVTGPSGLAGGGPLTLSAGANGPTSLGRIDLGSAMVNEAAYTITVESSTGPECDATQDLCVSALVGDFDSDGSVTAADKATLVGFVFQSISQANARFDIQNTSGETGTIDVADVGAWTGFFGRSVLGDPCPTP